jgi:hypothetical protein
VSARISDIAELRRQAEALRSGPGIAKVEVSERELWKKCASARFKTHVVLAADGSQRNVAETYKLNEAAVRRPEVSMSQAWWVEAAIEHDPDGLLRWIDSVLRDVANFKKTGT